MDAVLFMGNQNKQTLPHLSLTCRSEPGKDFEYIYLVVQ